MKRAERAPRRSDCPLHAALDMVGDRWSLLVVRDLMLFGRQTFKAFLEGGECIATNVLADRLRRLERLAIVARVPDPDDGRRTLYRLTAKGMDLAPVLIELVLWAARHEETGAPRELLDEMQHRRASFLARLRKQWQEQSAPAAEPAAAARRSPRKSRARRAGAR
jgi:DNA-binding HxlR family transcriptional regulator